MASGASALTASYYLDGSPRTVDDGGGTSALSYDGSGALAWEQESPDASGAFPTSAVATTYGSAEQAQSALWATNAGLSDTTQWTYNPDGSLHTIALPNVTTDTYVPNNNDTISSATLSGGSGQLAAWTYTYNGANQILTQGFSGTAGASSGGTFVSGAPAATFSMTYDPAMRLQSFRQGDANPTQEVGWDHNGDRTTWQTLSGGGGTSGAVTTTTATYNADTSIATTQVGTGPARSSVYAPFGGTTSDGCSSYAYDGFDRVTQATPVQGANCATGTVNYTYDPLGRQATHSDTSTTTHFLGLSSAVDAEISSAGSAMYEPTPNGVEGVTQGATTQFLSDDGNGTLSTAIGSDGKTVACTARFDPFGTPLGAPSGQSTNPCASGATISDLFYRGAIRNPTTGDYQFGQRVYDPTKGAFLTADSSPTLDPKQDPSAGTDPLTANTYAYVNGDPMNLSDPSGHHVDCEGTSEPKGSGYENTAPCGVGASNPVSWARRDDLQLEGAIQQCESGGCAWHPHSLLGVIAQAVATVLTTPESATASAYGCVTGHCSIDDVLNIAAVIPIGEAGGYVGKAFKGLIDLLKGGDDIAKGVDVAVRGGADTADIGADVSHADEAPPVDRPSGRDSTSSAEPSTSSDGPSSVGSRAYAAPPSIRAADATGGAETFFRTMSNEDFSALQSTGNVSATGETFISPSAEYAAGYSGRLVQFTVQPGTTDALAGIGVRDSSALLARLYPDMPLVSSGWNASSAFFKAEGGIINIGLGRGAALDLFNNAIQAFEEVPG